MKVQLFFLDFNYTQYFFTKEELNMTLQNRRNDILRLIESLDIPPSLYKNAEEKYKAITKYLIEHGFDAEMYPQG